VLRADVRVARGTFALDVALDVAAGETVLVVGPSGVGKTTAIRALAGLLRPAAGRISCGGTPWFDADARIDRRPRDRRIGVVVQEGALLPHLSARRNVAFAIDEGAGAERRATALGLLLELGLGDRVDARPAALSGGERQRVALARALARRPAALLLDEPFSALDGATHDEAAGVLARAVAALRIPAVVVSHDPRDAARLGARTVVLRDGALRDDRPGGEPPAAARDDSVRSG
jgi:molybdate transport system ATP-binding protein